MKKKLLTVLAISVVFLLAMVGCTPDGTGGGGGGGDDGKIGVTDFTRVSIEPLAALTDFSRNATVTALTYDVTVRAQQVEKLKEKQAETDDNLDDADEDYSTYTKIFKRADAEEIVNRMAAAALAQARMVNLVGYISREDATRPEGLTVLQKVEQGLYIFEKGRESLIRDYEDIDELQEYYDKEGGDDVYDALARKKRKVSQESILIFENEADQYARTMLEELLYVNQVVDARANLEYGEGGDAKEKYINYFRDIYFDYETLSFMLSFNDTVDLVRDAYTANERADFVKLYAFHYQYQKKDTEALTDAEHLRYLLLSHKTVMSDVEAEEYRDLDSKSYAKAYRYTDSFYKIYYQLYFQFQSKQEEYDRKIYVGGSNGQYNDGLGYASSQLTYSSEMRAALDNMGSVLKITDTEHQYASFRANVINMNRANTKWNGLTATDQGKTSNKLLKVNLELENLKAQDYSLNYNKPKGSVKGYLSDVDFSNSIKYQVKSYSADYVRTIQAYKKEDVILNKELDRLIARGATEEEIAAKVEEIGRNTAMFTCLTENYASADINIQMTNAENVEWNNIRAEIKEAQERDYETYHKNHQSGNAIKVDTYFEDNLIKKKYSCKGTATNCNNGNSHANCSKEYDTDCRISRVLNNHENVFRHAYGQVVITYSDNASLAAYRIDTVSANYNPTLGSGNGAGVYSKDATAKPANSGYVNNNKGGGVKSETIDSDTVPTLATFKGNKWEGIIPNEGNIKVNNATVDTNATITYTTEEDKVTYRYYLEFDGWFVDKQLQWRAKDDETFSYDVRLYPGYRITKIVEQ